MTLSFRLIFPYGELASCCFLGVGVAVAPAALVAFDEPCFFADNVICVAYCYWVLLCKTGFVILTARLLAAARLTSLEIMGSVSALP